MSVIPGEPAVVASGASELDTVAATLLRLASTLDLVADEDVTVGQSVDAIRDRTTAAARSLRDAHPRYDETAGALHDYAIALRDVQDRADRARSTIDIEADSIRYYEHEIWELKSQDIMLAVTIPDPAQAAADAKRMAWLKSQLAAHQSAQYAAQSSLDAAVADWHSAAAAARISPVLGQLNDSLLDHITSFVEGLGDFMAGIAEWITKILDTIITTVLLVIMVVVALVILVVALVALFPILALLLATGAMTINEILEFLIGITLVLVPILTTAVAFLMLREAMTPTPKPTLVAPAGGRFVKKGDRTNYEYLFAHNDELDHPNGEDSRDSTTIEVVQVLDANGNPALDENGNPIWRVMLPSTQDWQLGMGGAFGDNGGVNDLGSNLALIMAPEMQAAYERAVLQAMHDAGIGPNDSVMLSGWSQGGILAGAIASDPNSGFNVRAVVVAGAPIDQMDIPDSVSVLAIQHEGDHVPLLDGVPAHQGSNWVTVEATSSGTGYPHNASYYATTASNLDSYENQYSNLEGIEQSQEMFFSGNEIAYQYEFSEADTAIA